MAAPIKPTDQIPINRIIFVIYGEPGAGKTSLAASARRSLVIDCDGGTHRSSFRKDVAPVIAYKDVLEIVDGRNASYDMNNYSTLVFDTASTLLGYMLDYSEQRNPKKAKTSGGNPTQFGWGEISGMFRDLMLKLKRMNKDIIVIAQERTKSIKGGDDERYEPEVKGGSNALLFENADFVGRLYYSESGRSIDFNPSQFQRGKNCANLPVLTVPDFTQEPDWFAGIISKAKARLGKPAFVHPLVQKWNERVANATTANEFTDFAAEVPTLTDEVEKNVARNCIMDAAERHGFVWNATDKCFEKPEVKTTVAPVAPAKKEKPPTTPPPAPQQAPPPPKPQEPQETPEQKKAREQAAREKQFADEWRMKLANASGEDLDKLAAESLAFPEGTVRRNVSWEILMASATERGYVWNAERKQFGLKIQPPPAPANVDTTTGEILEEDVADGW